MTVPVTPSSGVIGASLNTLPVVPAKTETYSLTTSVPTCWQFPSQDMLLRQKARCGRRS